MICIISNAGSEQLWKGKPALIWEPSATNEQHFPATAVGVQEGEFMLVNFSLIFGSTIVGFSLYHLGQAFLDFTLILSESSALNLLLLSKTTHLTIGV